MEQAAELRELVSGRDVLADMVTRARIVLWSGEGRRRKDIAELLGVSPPTVGRWKTRYADRGLAGLEGDRPGGPREQVPARVRARVIALTRMTPPDDTGLSHWSTRELAKYLKRTEDISVSWHYIARIWREESLRP
ncbi:helix-turn-helix domain-containing protein, partial [Streptomyces sp. NPDC056549]|uniref:helix-turn-helix domain-containing protein n=1 Tax=Streptomyces sp. NPDC056549 TaxID=3345864 RepID=UPI0036C6313D